MRGGQHKKMPRRSSKSISLHGFIADDDDDDDDDENVNNDNDTTEENIDKNSNTLISADVVSEIRSEIQRISETTNALLRLDDSHDIISTQKLHELQDLILKRCKNLRESFAGESSYEKKVKKIISTCLKSCLTGTESFIGKIFIFRE